MVKDSRNPLGCAFNDPCPTSLDKYNLLRYVFNDSRNPLGCAFNDPCPTSLDKYNPLDSWSMARLVVLRIREILLVARLDAPPFEFPDTLLSPSLSPSKANLARRFDSR